MGAAKQGMCQAECHRLMQRNKMAYPSHAKLLGLLRAVQEELVDVPLYYTMSGLSKTLRASTPKMDALCNAIAHAGYRVSLTHCSVEGIKTDAPPEVCGYVLITMSMLWHICRAILTLYSRVMSGSLAVLHGSPKWWYTC
jgi:tRNA G26 N,N-dimethylase Trm1